MFYVKQILALTGVVIMSMISLSVSAELKVAVVDVQRAILQSEEAKRLLGQIEAEFKENEDEIRTIQSEAAALLERLQKDGDVMSNSEQRRLRQQVESKNNDFVYLRQKLRRQIDERQKELFAGIDQKVQQAIEDLVAANDYDIVIPSQAALWVSPIYNVTRKVTERLNAMDQKASR